MDTQYTIFNSESFTANKILYAHTCIHACSWVGPQIHLFAIRLFRIAIIILTMMMAMMMTMIIMIIISMPFQNYMIFKKHSTIYGLEQKSPLALAASSMTKNAVKSAGIRPTQ